MDESVGSAQSQAEKERLLLLSVVTTFCSLVPTAYVALIANSVTLYADLLRCLAEFLAIFCSWLVIRKIRSEDRSRYNYGFGKLERLSSLFVAGSLLVTFCVSFSLGLWRFWNPEELYNSEYGLLFAVFSVVGNALLWGLNYRQCQKAYSPVIDSQWRLFRAKTAASATVVFSLGIALFLADSWFAPFADALGAVILAGFLLQSALVIISDSMGDLVDRSLEEVIQFKVLATLVKYDREYAGFHRIRSRRSGSRVYIELSLEFDGQRSMADVRRTIEKIKTELEAEIAGSEITITLR